MASAHSGVPSLALSSRPADVSCKVCHAKSTNVSGSHFDLILIGDEQQKDAMSVFLFMIYA